VLADIGALDVPELVVVNKLDAADPLVIARLRRDERSACLVSARTGDGVDALRERIAELVPQPDVPVTLLVPYDRGAVVARVHRHGVVDQVEHTAEGTRMQARLPAWLAGDVASYAL
jgi:GTP-binding protein HflX